MTVPYADLVDADPPPRELTPAMRRYLFHQSWRTSAFFGVSLFLAAVCGFIFVRFPGTETGVAAGVGVALLIAATVRVLRKQARLRAVLVDGVQTPARVAAADHHAMPTNVPGVRARWSDLTVEIEGKKVRLLSLDRELEVLQPGAWLRVLVHPEHPDLIVPVSSVM